MSHWNRADLWLVEFIKTNVRPMDFLENEEKPWQLQKSTLVNPQVPYIFGITVDFVLPRFNINLKQLLPQHFRSISIIPGIIQKHNMYLH